MIFIVHLRQGQLYSMNTVRSEFKPRILLTCYNITRSLLPPVLYQPPVAHFLLHVSIDRPQRQRILMCHCNERILHQHNSPNVAGSRCTLSIKVSDDGSSANTKACPVETMRWSRTRIAPTRRFMQFDLWDASEANVFKTDVLATWIRRKAR